MALCAFLCSLSTTFPNSFMVSRPALNVLSSETSSNTIRFPEPWSKIPFNFFSRTISESLASTWSRGRSMSLATWAISTLENGSMIRIKFWTRRLSSSALRCAEMNQSLLSCSAYFSLTSANLCMDLFLWASAMALIASVSIPAYLTPALVLMRVYTSAALLVMILTISIYLRHCAALTVFLEVSKPSKPSKKYEYAVLKSPSSEHSTPLWMSISA
mmetsp:Transcript_6913/g.12708  ORF Transcript_6913/g.12708 Transcript_6913/m.12708 type:complete len:216 (-) Transcript_6913:683-1330(-)